MKSPTSMVSDCSKVSTMHLHDWQTNVEWGHTLRYRLGGRDAWWAGEDSVLREMTLMAPSSFENGLMDEV